MDVSIFDVFNSLEKNNSVAGGGYIEKINESYFIRGEGLVTSIEDIQDIVVTNKGDIPVYVRDVANVGFGHANRFGAITGNGEGEKVLGQVMMLKDANSNAVIEAVKQRVAEIQSSLPKGISINPFLERSELIAKTTFTIAENLILGCLIVIFVVVLLLGNLRSGLVVASVIPLCLLFALSLMYIFGVDANLMSLGAIDFGIIIDGAVIIVEFIAFKITSQRAKLLALPIEERQGLIDTITYQGASKMMNSAVFGQLIIIIVFIPILSLVNVEGKMFRPMALVFCFALIGAMLLCFTYIPVMASLFIKPSNTEKKTISSRLITFLENKYRPTITWALRKKTLVLSMAVALLVFTGFLFTRMGGEFVPTLDEGDFVIQPVLKTGMSLSKTIEATTKIEKILKQFPEHEIQEAKRILKLVGLSGKESRKAYMISGGEKRRVAIARALMQKPTILLADEIVSELDHVTAREIMDLILDAQKKMNLTAIMVHHDMALALEYANRVAVMKEGKKILEIGVEGDTIVDFQAGDMSIEEIMEMYNTDAKE